MTAPNNHRTAASSTAALESPASRLTKALPSSLFAAGVLASVSGAAKVPATVGGWPDTLPVSIAGAVVAVVGLVLWHKHHRARAAAQVARAAAAVSGSSGNGGAAPSAEFHVDASGECDADPITLLHALHKECDELQRDLNTLNAPSLCERVDRILQHTVVPFADVRSQITDRYGMEHGSEILITFAYGERMLNRVWSAASDGHLPEARAAVPEAVAAFADAVAMSAVTAPAHKPIARI